MTAKEQAALIFGVWAFVYVSVLALTYLIRWLELDLPLEVELLVSTSLTVPFITYVAVPAVKRMIARAEGKPADALE